MSKIIIDNNLIDLEMITHIEKPRKDWDDGLISKAVEDNSEIDSGWKTWYWGFNIFVVGCKKPIFIYRAWKGNSNYKDAGDAHASILRMYDELTRRWSPNTTKFDDITVK